MNLKHAGVALALLLPTAAWADGIITGKVISKETGLPLDYATVALERASDGKYVTGTTTDDDGCYTLPSVRDGSYVLRVTYVGATPQTRAVTVKGANIVIDPIQLAENTTMLKEVEVVGVRGQMRFELDRKVFNVDSNIAAAGVSASDLLESIPSVEVDQDGEISLRGNSSVTVWINGKESGLSSDNRAQILEQIPAETIERIEVITNPSAKYSPEGTAGIINIVLKKDRRAGYFGSAELGANTSGGGNANFNINANYGKWEGYVGLGLRMRHNKGGSETHRTYHAEDWFLNSDGDSRRHGNGLFMRLGLTYHFDAKNELSLSGFGMLGHNWSHSTTNYVSNLPSQWLTNRNYSRSSGDMRGAHGELTYKHTWTDTHTLEMMVGFNHWGGPSHNIYDQRQEWPADSLDLVYQEQKMNIQNNSIEAKIDYTNQLTEWLKLEAGYNGNFNHENTPTTTWDGTTTEDMALDPALFNRFIYNNNINALYFTLGGKVSKLSFSAGLRGEAWQVRTWSLAYGQAKDEADRFSKNFFSLFPSAFISYSLPQDNEIQINYTRRIRRPWGGQLNSFVDISNPTNLSFGNPELSPQYSNSFELNYIKTWTCHLVSLSAYLRQSSGVTNRISYLDGDVLYTTWANAGREVNSGVEIVGKNQFFKVLDLTTTVNLYNSHRSAWHLDFRSPYKDAGDQTFAVSGDKQNSFAWDLRCMASVRLPWQLSFQATGRYNSRQLTAQGSREPGWSVDAGLRKVVGDWSFSINCRDIFNSRKWHNFTYGDGYSQENKQWRHGRRVQFTIKYSFGNMSRPKGDRRGDSDEPTDGSGYGDSFE